MSFEENSGFTFMGFKNMTDEERERYYREHPFEYQSIGEYIADICKWLVECSDWRYTQQQAMDLIETRMRFVKEAYKGKWPIDLAACEIGFVCG
ncbi:MAG: hypothetical protein ACI4KM_06125 [Oscillospiraceae bacterium]